MCVVSKLSPQRPASLPKVLSLPCGLRVLGVHIFFGQNHADWIEPSRGGMFLQEFMKLSEKHRNVLEVGVLDLDL